MVDKDHVAALSDNASVLLSSVVFLIMNGNEHTLISIIPIPHNKKDNWINGMMEKWIDSIIIILVIGTNNAETWKKGLSFFPRIYIPKGNAKANAPTNLNELNDAISGSEKPFFLRKIFKIKMKATWIKLRLNSSKNNKCIFSYNMWS